MANGSKAYKVRSVGTVLTANTDNVIYTCPVNHTAKVELLFVTNTSTGTRTITIQWYDSSEDQYYYIIGGYNISAHNYLKLDGSYIVLQANDKLIVTPEPGSQLHSVVSVEEYFDPMNG